MTDSSLVADEIAFAFTRKGIWEANKELAVAIDRVKAQVRTVTATEEVAGVVESTIVPALDAFRATYLRYVEVVDRQIASGAWAADRRVQLFRTKVDEMLESRDQLAALVGPLRAGALSLPNAWQAVFDILLAAMPGGDDDD